jgi:hypothetical protein
MDRRGIYHSWWVHESPQSSKNSFGRFKLESAISLIGQVIGAKKSGCSAVQFFDPNDCAFVGLRLWTTQSSKKGTAAKGEVKYVI